MIFAFLEIPLMSVLEKLLLARIALLEIVLLSS